MKIGIIAEFNPLHSGHIHLLETVKKQFPTASIYIIMSSYLTQRGEFAFIDPYQKVQLALAHGADFVFELPPFLASQRADLFATGAIAICQKLQLDAIAFGVESLDFFTHQEDSPNLEPNYEAPFLQRIQTLNSRFREKRNWQPSANNILAHFYLEAAAKLAPDLRFLPIQRIGSDYNDADLKTDIASATAIRKAVCNQQLDAIVPFLPYDPSLLSRHLTWEMLYPLFQYALITQAHLETIATVGKSGLASRMQKAIKSPNFEVFINQVKTRAYTRTSIQRAMLFTLLNITQAELDTYTEFALTLPPRLLGLTEAKSRELKQIEHILSLDTIDNENYVRTIRQIEQLYSLILPPPKPQHFPFIFKKNMA